MIGDLSRASRHPSLTGEREGRHTLTIGGKPWTEHATDIAFEYTDTNGASRLTFRSREPMEHLIGREVILRLGYGDELVPYFVGELISPMPDPPDFTSRAVALGPFALMTLQYFGEPVSYRGIETARVLWDIASRAYLSRSRILISGGAGIVQEVLFAENVSLMEAALAITGPSEMVMTDDPDGSRRFMPRPRPGSSGKARAVLGPDHYEKFEPDPEHAALFKKVVVFRKSANTEDEGGYEVRAQQPVPQDPKKRPAHRGRIWYVSDFPGDQREADKAAYDLARKIGRGAVPWSMTGVTIDPTFRRYDQIEGVRDVEKHDGTYRQTYELSIEGGIKGSVASWKMDLAGEGLLKTEHKIAPARITVGRLSSGVVSS